MIGLCRHLSVGLTQYISVLSFQHLCLVFVPTMRASNARPYNGTADYFALIQNNFCIPATPQPTVSAALLTQGSQWGTAELSGALPPLCKGRWVGLGRLGGVVYSYLCGVAAHLSCRQSLPCLPLEGKVSAQPTDEVFFRWRTYIAPIRFLRQPGIETTA